MIDINKPRLTANHNGKYGLVNVKDNEQEVESPYPNTLKAILECFERLGELENAIKSGELAPVVDCVIRIFDYLEHEGVDIEEVIAQKHAYNLTREYKHGKAY